MKGRFFTFLALVFPIVCFSQFTNPQWGADSQELFLTEWNNSNNNSLYRIGSDGSDLEAITLPVEIGEFINIKITPRGERIIVVKKSGISQIYRFESDGTNPVKLTKNEVDEFHPVPSPDGKRLAYLSTVKVVGQLYIMNLDGSNNRLLMESKGSVINPKWSPDGNKMIFNELNPLGPAEGRFRQWIFDGKELLNPVDGRKINMVGWKSNDVILLEERVCYGLTDCKSAIIEMDLSSSKENKILKNFQNFERLFINPKDNNKFLLVSGSDIFQGQAEVFVFTIGDKKPLKVGKFNNAQWSPDGSQIACDNGQDIFVVKFDNTKYFTNQITYSKKK